MKQITTSSGMNLILRGLAGATINFTKIKFGNGEEQGVTAVDLSNPIMELEITKITRAQNYITLETSYKNADVPTDFSAHEIGVFAQDPDDETKEICYCLWYEEDPVKADYISAVEDRILGTKFEFLVFVDTVENVTAILAESTEFATQAALNQHINNFSNPHKVDKKAVGLGNVDNVTAENLRPVFDLEIGPIQVSVERNPTTMLEKRTTKFPNIEKGDTLGAMVKKIRTAFSVVLSHLSGDNPHCISALSIGAAARTHYHSANQINTGTLGLKRGGTGGSTAAEARENLGIKTGQFSFDLVAGKETLVSFDFATPFDGETPYIAATPMKGVRQQLEFGIRGFSATGFEVFAYSPTYSGRVTFNWIACL